MTIKIAIFISGRGSNMQALAAHAKCLSPQDFPFEIGLVFSNNPDALGLEWAKAQGILTISIDHRPYGKNRTVHEALLNKALLLNGIDFIVLAGYMRVLSADFCEMWDGRMINIHPSLLPLHKGLNTHRRALESGDKVHGCTVHWVSAGVDEGQIIDSESVTILKEDTEESLASRVLEAEHKLYPRALDKALKQRFGQ